MFYNNRNPKYFLPLSPKDNICGKMYSVHDTFFDEVRHEGYETVMPCDEVAVFSTKAGMGTGYKVAPMLSDSFSIILVKSGTVKLSVNYCTETLQKNSMAFLMPNMVVSLSDADGDFMMEGVSFMPAYFDDLSAYAPVYNQMISFANENAMPIRSMSDSEMECMLTMLKLYSDINTEQLHYNGLMMHLSNLLLLRFAEMLRAGYMSDTSKVSHPVEIYREFRKLLTNNYLKEHYILFYSSQLNVSSTYLSRIVRKISGRSVNEHIAHMLITEARRLLDCTDLPVKQIAYRLGFADHASFGKFFRKQFGVSPTEYRTGV